MWQSLDRRGKTRYVNFSSVAHTSGRIDSLSFLKKLLPIAGAAAGFFGVPGAFAGTAVNAALGSGIGTLLAGGDVKDAVKNAVLAGGAGMAMGAPATAAGAAGSTAGASAATQQALEAEKAIAALDASVGAAPAVATEAASKGILSAIPKSALAYGGLGLAAAALAEEPEQPVLTELEKAQIAKREVAPYYEGRDIVRRYDYSQEPTVYAAQGGYIEGPGTGRSDSVKSGIYQNGQKVQEARLSDGEFVMTEQAVRGAGNGNRAQGAARMYEMMRQYERMA